MPEASPFDPEIVRELAKLIAETNLTEIEVEKGDLRIRVARIVQTTVTVPVGAGSLPSPLPPSSAVPPAADAPVAIPKPAGNHPSAVLSPMVGTAFRKPSPDSKAFVEVGARVEPGEKLLLVEAMKTFNEIVAPRAGTVTAVFVEDGQPVEYGEPLLLLE